MTDTAISPLRRRMIEDMTIRQFRPTTQHNYVRFVKKFSIFFGRAPDKAAFEDVRRYQLHLTSQGISQAASTAGGHFRSGFGGIPASTVSVISTRKSESDPKRASST
jgi:Phage integrase, N-terminal SAM-like domain